MSQNSTDKEIQIGEYEGLMPDLDESIYTALKRSIAEHGLEYPILVDRNRQVIDGHHRLKACREVGVEPEVIVVDTDHDPERAYRPNLARRDFSSGAKREAVKQYLIEYYDGERKQQEIADDLGVDKSTISRALSEIDGNLLQVQQFSTEEKREQVRDYIESHPDASNRDVSDAVEADVSHATVGNWRSEWGDEESDQQPLKGFASGPDQASDVSELFEKAQEDDDEVSEAAKEQAEELAEGKSSPDRAKKKVRAQERKQEQKEKEEQALSETDLDELGATITDDQSLVQCDAVITDPPYGILSETEWEPDELKSFTLDWLSRWNESGADFLASFWSQEHLYQGRDWFDEALNDYTYQQTLIWNCPNNKKHHDRDGFKRTWEPILFYRRRDSAKQINLKSGPWGDEIKDFDLHTAAVPQQNYNDEDRREHPAQKPLSVMEWLVVTLTEPGDTIVDPFCGTGTAGIAACKHDREFYGIETDEEYRSLSEKRIARYA